MSDFYTYIHCKPDGTPFYIGKGNGNRSHHFNRRNNWHTKVVKKYGRQNIGIYVFECESEAQAVADERQQIAQLRSQGYELCNITDGGEGMSGLKHSEETKRRISKASIGNKYATVNKGRVFSDSHRAALALSNLGNKNALGNKNGVGKTPWLGRKHSPESCAKMTAIRIGKKASAETRKKMSLAKIGRKSPDGMKAALAKRWPRKEVPA